MTDITTLGKKLRDMITITSEQYQKPSARAFEYHVFLNTLLTACGAEGIVELETVKEMRAKQESLASQLIPLLEAKCLTGELGVDYLHEQIAKSTRFDALADNLLMDSLDDSSEASSSSDSSFSEESESDDEDDDEEEEEEEESSETEKVEDQDDYKEGEKKRKCTELIPKEDLKKVKCDEL